MRVWGVLLSHQEIRKTHKERGIKRANYDRSFYFMKVTEGYLWECVQFHSSALRCKNAKPADPRQHSIICSHAHVRGMLMEIANINTGLKKVDLSDSAKLLWRSVGLHLCLSIFFPFISPFSLLANTCVLIPAPSTLSAGGHRQTPSPPFSPPSSLPCFSTLSCLSNGPHLGEIEPFSACLPKHGQRADLDSACCRNIPLGWRQADTSP